MAGDAKQLADDFNFLVVAWLLEYETIEIWIVRDLKQKTQSFSTEKPTILDLSPTINVCDLRNKIAFYTKEQPIESRNIVFDLMITKLAFEEYKQRATFKYKNICVNLQRDIRYPLNLLLTSNQISNDDKRKTLSATNRIFDFLDIYNLETNINSVNKLNKFILFSVEQEIQYIINATKLLCNSAHIVIMPIFYDSIPKFIYFDSKSLKQIITNILQHCIKHHKAQNITITIYADILVSEKNYVLNFIIQYDNSDDIAKENSFLPVELLGDNSYMGLRISYLLAKKLHGNLIANPDSYHLDFTTSSRIESLTLKKLSGKNIQFILSDSFTSFTEFKTLDEIIKKYKIRVVPRNILDKTIDFIIRDLNPTHTNLLRIEDGSGTLIGYLTRTMSEIAIKNLFMRGPQRAHIIAIIILDNIVCETLLDVVDILKKLNFEVILSEEPINDTRDDMIVYNYAVQPKTQDANNKNNVCYLLDNILSFL